MIPCWPVAAGWPGLVAQGRETGAQGGGQVALCSGVDKQSHLLLRVDMVDRRVTWSNRCWGGSDRQPAPWRPWHHRWPAANCPDALALEDAGPAPSRP